MRDGIEMAKRGVPTVALVTEKFWPQGDFVADAAQMSDLPRIRLPHPVAGIGDNAMATLAERLAPTIAAALAGAAMEDC